MKAICEGRKTRREVVDETIEQYRAVYMLVQQRLNVLKEVRPRFSRRSSASTDMIQSVRRYVTPTGG